MIAPIPTILRPLSSLLLALSSSPPDPIRDALEATVRHVSRLVGWANITVATGVAMEGVELIHDAIAWIKRRRFKKKELVVLKEIAEIFPTSELELKAESNSDHPAWVKRFTRIGLIVVVAGVVAEWRCGAKLEDAHDAVHEYDLGKLTEANQKAGDAATSAKTAHDEAKAVKVEADAIQGRLDAASAQLSGMEQQVRVQGPRWKLLEDNESEFIRALKPFSGQRATIIKCGDAIQPEPQKLAQDLLNFLGIFTAIKQNAGWRGGIYREWHTCKVWPTAVGGNLVVTSSSASESVKAAAKALNDTLNKINISTMGVIAPDSPEARILFDATEGADSPMSLALKDPTQVFILVGTNPMTVDTFGWRKLHKRSARP